MAAVRSQGGRLQEAERLASVLRDARELLRDDEPATLAVLLEALEREDTRPLAVELAAFAELHGRVPFADLLGVAARGLAPTGEPPTDEAGATAWRAVLQTVADLYGDGFRRLGRLDFLDDALVEQLLTESRQVDRRFQAPGQQIADPGPVLRRLAVDSRLTAAVAGAFDANVAPSYRAVYMYLEPGEQVHPHVDHADYEIIVHVTLAHVPPANGSRRAALVVCPLDAPPERVELAPGEAMALRGRGTIHFREPLQGGESWTTLAIGFAQNGDTDRIRPDQPT